MSHFTHLKTQFQNLFYLKKALTKLNIQYQKNSSGQNSNLLIPQSNGYDLEFAWNGQEYELVADLSFWDQDYSVEGFIDQVAQQYAGELVNGETQKIGFQPVQYESNADGSNTLILERWNT